MGRLAPPVARLAIPLLAGVAALGLVAGCAPGDQAGRTATEGVSAARGASASQFRGFPLSTPFRRPAVTLTDTAGAAYDFAARTRGRVTLVYLGYTHCTDTCPAVMADLAAALRGLPSSVRDEIIVVFITTDPRRDSGPVIRRWLDRFDPKFVGLTGTSTALRRAYTAFGVNPKVVLGPHGGEEVEHSADLYAFDTDNMAVLSYDPDSTPADYRHDLPLLAAGRTPPKPSATQLFDTGGAGRAGLVEVFNARLVAGPGDTAQLRLTALNNGNDRDSIVGVRTEVGGAASIWHGNTRVRSLPLRPGTPVVVGGQDRIVVEHASLHDRRLVHLTVLLADGAQLALTVPVTTESHG